MRIVGGIFKAKNLKEFSNPAIRPTADKTRESLFDIFGERIRGAKFLDLFAGTGGVGIEAISRGAKKVTFVDADKSCLDLVKQNIKAVGAESADHELKLSDGLKFLSETNEKFDYIFIDPPYKTDLGQKALKIIFERELVSETGAAIFETEFDLNSPYAYLYDERTYGRAKLGFYTYKKPACVFAGTFDPVTKGHLDIIKKAENEFFKVHVAVMVNKDKTPMFPLATRLELLNTLFAGDPQVTVVYSDGLVVDYLKKVGTDYYVRGVRNAEDLEYEKKNEELSRAIYPDIKTIYYKADKSLIKCSSSAFKEAYFSGGNYKKYLPKEIIPVTEKALEELKK